MKLTAHDFFHYYALHADAKELSSQQKKQTKYAALAYFILTLGIGAAVTYLLSRSFKPKSNEQGTEKQTQDLFNRTVKPASKEETQSEQSSLEDSFSSESFFLESDLEFDSSEEPEKSLSDESQTDFSEPDPDLGQQQEIDKKEGATLVVELPKQEPINYKLLPRELWTKIAAHADLKSKSQLASSLSKEAAPHLINNKSVEYNLSWITQSLNQILKLLETSTDKNTDSKTDENTDSKMVEIIAKIKDLLPTNVENLVFSIKSLSLDLRRQVVDCLTDPYILKMFENTYEDEGAKEAIANPQDKLILYRQLTNLLLNPETPLTILEKQQILKAAALNYQLKALIVDGLTEQTYHDLKLNLELDKTDFSVLYCLASDRKAELYFSYLDKEIKKIECIPNGQLIETYEKLLKLETKDLSTNPATYPIDIRKSLTTFLSCLALDRVVKEATTTNDLILAIQYINNTRLPKEAAIVLFSRLANHPLLVAQETLFLQTLKKLEPFSRGFFPIATGVFKNVFEDSSLGHESKKRFLNAAWEDNDINLLVPDMQGDLVEHMFVVDTLMDSTIIDGRRKMRLLERMLRQDDEQKPEVRAFSQQVRETFTGKYSLDEFLDIYKSFVIDPSTRASLRNRSENLLLDLYKGSEGDNFNSIMKKWYYDLFCSSDLNEEERLSILENLDRIDISYSDLDLLKDLIDNGQTDLAEFIRYNIFTREFLVTEEDAQALLHLFNKSKEEFIPWLKSCIIEDIKKRKAEFQDSLSYFNTTPFEFIEKADLTLEEKESLRREILFTLFMDNDFESMDITHAYYHYPREGFSIKDLVIDTFRAELFKSFSKEDQIAVFKRIFETNQKEAILCMLNLLVHSLSEYYKTEFKDKRAAQLRILSRSVLPILKTPEGLQLALEIDDSQWKEIFQRIWNEANRSATEQSKSN